MTLWHPRSGSSYTSPTGWTHKYVSDAENLAEIDEAILTGNYKSQQEDQTFHSMSISESEEFLRKASEDIRTSRYAKIAADIRNNEIEEAANIIRQSSVKKFTIPVMKSGTKTAQKK